MREKFGGECHFSALPVVCLSRSKVTVIRLQRRVHVAEGKIVKVVRKMWILRMKTVLASSFSVTLQKH